MRKEVVLCFIKRNNKFIFFKRSDKLDFFVHLWSPIGGSLEKGEDPRSRVIIELKEEANIIEKDLIYLKKIGVFEQEDKINDRYWIRHAFIAEIKEDTPVEIDWEHDEYKEYFVNDAIKLDMPPQSIEIFRKII